MAAVGLVRILTAPWNWAVERQLRRESRAREIFLRQHSVCVGICLVCGEVLHQWSFIDPLDSTAPFSILKVGMTSVWCWRTDSVDGVEYAVAPHVLFEHYDTPPALDLKSVERWLSS